ncbi:c-type cytochrome [Rubrivivax sp. A210]|uniref:c-type cytochrome n=1 Tax=Rubrivivax sp. A210 TaxID=2772301 RepID=UPI001F2D13CA|nr:c-type cytochrome [Rubrivivax sp. A210]
MKTTLLAAAVAAALAFALPAQAAPDAAAASALSSASGCSKCHTVDKGKRGPSYKQIAAKYKGQADAVAKLSDMVTKTPKVKYENGDEEEHKALNTKDAAKVRNLVEWVLAQ